MERWVLTNKKSDYNRIAEDFHIDPLLARVIRNRDVVGDEAIEEFLHGDLSYLHQPRLMKDMDKAMDVLQQGIREGKRIRIVGDYDIDGVCASYILYRGLTRLGAKTDAYLPNRITDGYGLHEEIVRQAAADQVEILVTCDNGIAAAREIDLAKELGMDVVVTDHHEVPYEDTEEGRQERLPKADAVVNPKRTQCPYPFKGLCGAAVAWKLICAMYERYALPPETKEEFLEIVAIATVGDVMDLRGENRILVKEGLKRLQNPSNVGLRALVKATNLSDGVIEAYHIGFVLGPCINASGRLDSAKRALNLLLSSSEEEAAALAGDLTAMNDSRKALTAKSLDEAIDLMEHTSLKDDKVLVIFLPACHESLAGIIAGRIRERYHRPTLVLTRSEEGVKGSGRSIEAYNMFQELHRCKELLTKFGGHPMAAGLSMEESKVPVLRKRLNELCPLMEEELMPKVTIDVAVSPVYFKEERVEALRALEPFGKGNTRPLFAARAVKVLKPKVFGKNRNVVQMTLETGEGALFAAVYFGDGEAFCEQIEGHGIIDIAYYPQIHEYNGRRILRMNIQNYRKAHLGN